MTRTVRALHRPAVFAPLILGLMAGLTAFCFCGRTAVAAAPRHQVLIYYANENSPSGAEAESYATIVGWLKSSDDEKLQNIAASLERDRRLFPAAVDLEISDLEDKLPMLRAGPGAILFTNRLVREGRCRLLKPGAARFVDEPFGVVTETHIILAGNPLSKAETLWLALEFAGRHFDPAAHDFVLITKSHGSAAKCITPRLNLVVRAEETNREEVLSVALGTVPDDELPSWASRLGISKGDYLEILGQAGTERGMRFSLVFMEACDAVTMEIAPSFIPDNVRQLLVVRENAGYQNLLYSDVLSLVDARMTLAQAMTTNRSDKFALILPTGSDRPDGHPTQSIPSYVYFTPLGAIVVWLVWRLLRSNHRRDDGDGPRLDEV